MRILHRLTAHVTTEILGELAALGITAREGLFTFEIDEADPRWPELSQFVERIRFADFVRTEFSPKELNEAQWLVMSSRGRSDIYPQPEDDFGFREATYDVTSHCALCGVGWVQKAPFRIKGEPRWGSRQVLQLEWIYDEFFARPEAWKTTFEPFGIGGSPALDHATGRALQTVVQLGIGTVARSRTLLGNQPAEGCPRCGRIKYKALVRGRFPALESFPEAHAFKTDEYFGDGASAFRETIVSRDLYREIRHHGLRGLHFTPVDGRRS